ncbi:MAG TPA: DOMON-like domain-containing protein [Oscillatoriales cyanobacterium M59_W2019_021]|nr:MAG: hypothetical protein D6728_15155 [Cyanobacteria bacterium J055]HIK30048.1 DOMON-like domain-containing protein [Oscillatoriales cyanobacterium M4454_W2019_049]HIK50383.1 DOMON-like domain-containing protein [Oscillatoriales cyanobacterium M59_W2019_021]
MSIDFKLIPFGADRPIPDIEIVGKIDRCQNHLSLQYQLLGDLEKIAIPAPSDSPKRQDELWRKTCFEWFVSIPNEPQYWEFNCSPSGDWNVYHFEDYRHKMQTESTLTELPFTIDRDDDRFALSVKLNLDRLKLGDRPLDLAITAVIQNIDETVTYWALTHTGDRPDFHRRDSFILAIDQ